MSNRTKPSFEQELGLLGLSATQDLTSLVRKAEETSNEGPVEILHSIMSSPQADQTIKQECLKFLRVLSPAYMTLPRSHYLNVNPRDLNPYASWGITETLEGRLNDKKVCVKTFWAQGAGNLDNVKKRFYPEIIVWKLLDHENVVPFLGVLERPRQFCIITPWQKNGNILEYIRRNDGVDPLKLLAQATLGLEYLHSCCVVHGGVKPGNILIAEDGVACLGDFGITSIITDPSVVDGMVLKPWNVHYTAPELLDPARFDQPNSDPTKESDIYSFAMAAYEVLTGTLPYEKDEDMVIMMKIVAGTRPSRPVGIRWLPERVWAVICWCWSEHRMRRYTPNAIYRELLMASQEIARSNLYN